MKQNKIGLFALVILAISIAVASSAAAEMLLKWRAGIDAAGSEYRIGQLYPLPVQETPTDGFLTVATPTLSVGTQTAVIVGTLPAGTHKVVIGALAGNLNIGNSAVPTNVYPIQVASGSFKEFVVSSLTPGIYVRGELGTVTVKLAAY
jgi:hypothetical protein